MNKLDCNIVRDLLPSYIEKLTDKKTDEQITNHLCECADCSRIYAEMTNGENTDSTQAVSEINFLKKIKSKNRRVIISIIFALVFIGVVLFVCYGVFGISTQGYTAENIVSTNDMLMVDIKLNYSSYGITKVNLNEKDGVLTIDVRSTAPVFRKSSEYPLRLTVGEMVTRIQTSNGQVLWENEEEISKRINDIYNAKVKYIGDSSAVGRLLEAIDLCSALKCDDYSIRLLTDKEPYGLEICDINLYDEMLSEFYNEGCELKIKSCAFLILACIENADFVKLNYIAPDGESKSYKLTVEEADDFLTLTRMSPKGTEISSLKDWSKDYWSLSLLEQNVEEQLLLQQSRSYQPYLEGLSDEAVALLNNNPIDKKYEYIHNNTVYGDMGAEIEIYADWADAYEKQYKIICNALLEYAKDNTELEEHLKERLIKDIEDISDNYKYSNNISSLYSSVYESEMGQGSIINYYYACKNLEEMRHKTLQLAECAYYLGVEFEWVE